LREHREPVHAVAFSPDNQLLATASGSTAGTAVNDFRTVLWNVNGWHKAQELLEGSSQGPLLFSPAHVCKSFVQIRVIIPIANHHRLHIIEHFANLPQKPTRNRGILLGECVLNIPDNPPTNPAVKLQEIIPSERIHITVECFKKALYDLTTIHRMFILDLSCNRLQGVLTAVTSPSVEIHNLLHIPKYNTPPSPLRWHNLADAIRKAIEEKEG
jgi:hypothetical protein